MSVPVVVTARHVRLTAAHAELLFGAGAADALLAICDLPPTGRYACAGVVAVRGADATLKDVRVVGPLVKQTEVHLGAHDAAALGDGCTLEAARGSVVLLASAMRVGLRRLTLAADTALACGLVGAARATVLVRGERERELRDVPIHASSSGASYLEVDVDDGNALEVGRDTVALCAATSSRAE